MTDEPVQIDARLHLLGRQVHDADDTPVCVIDDLELITADDPTPADPGRQPVDLAGPARVSSLVSGRTLLMRVFGGRLPESFRHRISWSDVSEVGLIIRLDVSGEELDQTFGERWMRDHIIGRIPGADDSSQ